MGRLIGVAFLLGMAAFAGDLSKPIRSLLNPPPPAAPDNPGSVAIHTRKMVDEEALAHLDPATRQEVIDNAPVVKIHMNPLMKALLDAEHKRERENKQNERVSFPVALQIWLDNHSRVIALWAARIPIALLLTAILALLIGAKGWGRALVTVCHSLSKMWLYSLSGVVIVIWLASRVNLLASLPNGAWSFPIAAILGCLFLIRFIDVNYPVWNATIMTFVAPLAARLVLHFT